MVSTYDFKLKRVTFTLERAILQFRKSNPFCSSDVKKSLMFCVLCDDLLKFIFAFLVSECEQLFHVNRA